MPPVGSNLIKRSFNETELVAFGLRDGLTEGLTRGLYVRFGVGFGAGVGLTVGRGINSGKIGFTLVGLGVDGFAVRGFVFALGPLPFLPSIMI